jgi:hypothetical protein
MPQCAPTQHNNKKKEKENAVIYTMEYYSVIKENEIMSFAGSWMKLKSSCFVK